VLASTAATLGIGIAVGLGLSVILSRMVTARVGSSSRDPVTLLAAASVLFFVAALRARFPPGAPPHRTDASAAHE